MGNKITDINKRQFFEQLGTQLSAARQQQQIEILDLSEMTGYTTGRLTALEQGNERRLLRINIEALLKICQALNKKAVITLQELQPEKTEETDLPDISNETLLKLISTKL